MIRAARYVRYSSNRQSAASIEDQFRICRDHAERVGWTIVDTYRDAAISGDSMILRPGIQALLADARSGGFEVVAAEALDRMSKDQADVSALFKHLKFTGVMIFTLAEGEINEFHVLSRLGLAHENVRKTPPDLQADASVKASITA